MWGGHLRRHAPRGARSTLRFAFAGAVRRREARRELDAPVLAVHWLTRLQLLERARALRTPLVLRCVDDYLGGRRVPLSALAT